MKPFGRAIAAAAVVVSLVAGGAGPRVEAVVRPRIRPRDTARQVDRRRRYVPPVNENEYRPRTVNPGLPYVWRGAYYRLAGRRAVMDRGGRWRFSNVRTVLWRRHAFRQRR